MAYIPPNEDTVHFVGGIGTKADRDQYNGGGCTKAAWDANGQLSDFMGANSGPVTSAVNATYTHATKTVTATGIGVGVTVGTLAYLSGTNFTNGVYEVTSVTDNDNLVFANISDSTGDNNDTTINVGGALDKLQNASDNASTSAGSYNRTVYTNLNENLTACIDIDTNGGSVAKNTKKKFIGFNTAPGDMDKDGAYYQGPLDAYVNGVDASKCVTYDAQGNAIKIFEFNSAENMYFQNLYVYNNNKASSMHGISIIGPFPGTQFINCKFETLYRGINGSMQNSIILDCFFTDIPNRCLDLDSVSKGVTVQSCVLDGFLQSIYCLGSGFLAYGNIFIGGMWGIMNGGNSAAIIYNNIFYNITAYCIYVGSVDATLMEFNNIFMPAAVDDYAVYISGDSGTVLYSNYSCAYCPAGDFTVDPWYNATNNKSFMGPSSIKDTDPQLVDAANGDFRPLEPAVLRGGRPDIASNPGQIGMVIQKYQFTQRARQVNRGRLAIIR